ncbi:MAG: PIG-L family deacetylase [Bryobacterales bacterium]|nr:PIG-L family deacetylase [Bryobacterales bacterium]
MRLPAIHLRSIAKRMYGLLIALVFHRSRYRMFLRVSLEQISVHTQTLVTLTDYFSTVVQPIPITAPFGKSMLVLAPHQDDETIGCGGAIALQAEAGAKVAVVIVQDGGDEHEKLNLSRQDMTARRNAESRRATEAIGIEPPICLNYRSLHASRSDAVAAVRQLLLDRKVDAVFTPFLLDNHADHRTTNAILAEAMGQLPWNVRVFGYEVWGLAIPNVIVAIDSVMEKKLAMLRCFEYANSALDYLHTTKGLNMYRSRLLPAGTCQFAECFFELDKSEFIRLLSILSTKS